MLFSIRINWSVIEVFSIDDDIITLDNTFWYVVSLSFVRVCALLSSFEKIKTETQLYFPVRRILDSILVRHSFTLTF